MYSVLANSKSNIIDIDERLAPWRMKYGAEFVAQNFELPQNPNEIPNILGWVGPARSGTTALLFLLAGHSEVGHVYFQPQKTLMRLGHPPIKLYPSDKIACMKETLLSWEVVDELYDPIDVLLKAGISAEKITWIFMLRDPLQTYGSWCMLAPGVPPDPAAYALWQAHTINLWRKYKGSKVKVVPFVYELLHDQEEVAIRHLLARVGLNDPSLKLEFDQVMIDKKFVPGQAANRAYFENNLKKSLSRGRYVYSMNSYPVDPIAAEEVVALCQERYEDFARIAKETLDL